jgi:segregation and condensation protein B
MKIAATPMCEEILKLAGVSDYKIINNLKAEEADIIFTLSETKMPENSTSKQVTLKLNTFTQIGESVKLISSILGTRPLNENLNQILSGYNKEKYKSLRLKVHAKFLKEIVEDMGFQVVDEKYDYLVYPDYLKKELAEEIIEAGSKAVELPSHRNVPKDPIKRAEIRYSILEKI